MPFEPVRGIIGILGKTVLFAKSRKSRKIVTVCLFYVTIPFLRTGVPAWDVGSDFLL